MKEIPMTLRNHRSVPATAALAVITALSLAAVTGCSHENRSQGPAGTIPGPVPRHSTIEAWQVPMMAQFALDRDYPGAKVNQVTRDIQNDGNVFYTYDITDHAKKKRKVTYNTTGDRVK
jgi:hypothetical protein